MSSGFDSSQPLINAIDNMASSCSSLSGGSKTWLRLDILTVRYIREVRFLFNGSASGSAIFIGRSLRNNGATENLKCCVISSDDTDFLCTCCLPVLGQVIYIERMATSMKICEIEVFYGKIIDFVSFSNQL